MLAVQQVLVGIAGDGLSIPFQGRGLEKINRAHHNGVIRSGRAAGRDNHRHPNTLNVVRVSAFGREVLNSGTAQMFIISLEF